MFSFPFRFFVFEFPQFHLSFCFRLIRVPEEVGEDVGLQVKNELGF